MNPYNHLINETSPYLLQHAENPVNWYPWCDEAFQKAQKENKPIFLSIGYSTCHWCHVMAHESFEDSLTADILNRYFISIKVDKEERPDIDSIYMRVCQALTGSGGWPTSIFMTHEQKPFFAGTYFPPKSQYGMVGFRDLLISIVDNWGKNREQLLRSSEEIMKSFHPKSTMGENSPEKTISDAVSYFKSVYDKEYGGFGSAPKFPSPHNLLFLMDYYIIKKDKESLEMVEKTLTQMYCGGIFDHIGFGFSRYSTDKYFLVPHFEKMLYDNALLILAYTKAYKITHNDLFKEIAQKTAKYVLREMTHESSGFFSAQDADSDGVEGKYYVFGSNEIIDLLGEDSGEKFNIKYDITPRGNFEEKNIPNLLKSRDFGNEFDKYLPQIYEYRKSRTKLHLDDKILTSWNALMISAFAYLYKAFNESVYLQTAEKACKFIEENSSENGAIFVSLRNGRKSKEGFLDDYAFYIFALINLYEVTFENKYIQRALTLTDKTLRDFFDEKDGGFYLYGQENEQLIIKPKDIYDGAMPCGNSVMCYNLIKLTALFPNIGLEEKLKKQIDFMADEAGACIGGNSFYLLSLLKYFYPDKNVVCVLSNPNDLEFIKQQKICNVNLKILEKPTESYALCNNKTTFYVCENHTCYPPTNDIREAFKLNL